MSKSVDFPLSPVSTLTISMLPGCRRQEALSQQAPQLVEATEYRYLVTGAQRFHCDLPEVFEADSDSGLSGRVRTRQLVGLLVVHPVVDGLDTASLVLEIRSLKLDYESHYRWMLQSLTQFAAELIMQRFSESRRAFRPGKPAPGTVYQRFAYLSGLLESSEFGAAWAQMMRQPHQKWVSYEERVLPGQPLKASSALARQLAAPGPRSERITPGGGLPLPLHLRRVQHEETRDTPENRFVRYVLLQWQAALQEVKALMQRTKTPESVALRARRELDQVGSRLERLLSEPLWREVGPLQRLPLSSSTLQKKSGYREFLRFYVQYLAASELSWDGGLDQFLASQRDIAALYEYWAYVQLAGMLSKLLGQELDWSRLVTQSEDGLGLQLRQGRQCMVSGQTVRRGRLIKVELWFNRTFSPGKGSWTLDMRPDCSLQITAAGREATWVHFDAKYKLDEVFPEGEDASSEAKKIDLLKMHSYRDAIRGSSGAYILYPGDRTREYPLYTEILPGLGAFCLRPGQDGRAEGEEKLLDFLDRVLDHFASQYTQHERSRHWDQLVQSQGLNAVEAEHLELLTEPPADTQVLLGFVRDQQHLDWILRTGLYNLRGDPERNGSVGLSSPELAVRFVVLYGFATRSFAVSGPPLLFDRERMRELGYPREPRGAYFCLPVQSVDLGIKELKVARSKVPGAPVVVRFDELKYRVSGEF